ncbi:MAG: threonine--tRNA ligase [Deltaproteobacteria bacterium]|jgi:threonyl-tRNA synthetase|nr:threonine--tRNA ligase [Deltaproteobacteria bacterium]
MTSYKVRQANDKVLEVEWPQSHRPSGAELFALAGLPKKGPGQPLAYRDERGLWDLTAPVTADAVSPVTAKDPEGLDLLRHSVAHILAEAVIKVFPEVKVAIGPSIEDGFYYDFDKPEPFTPEDLDKIAAVMSDIVKEGQPFARQDITVDEAIKRFTGLGEVYKVELIEDLAAKGESQVSLYQCGNFIDLCRGPHIPNTSLGGAFKLLSVAGAYWRGDSNRTMLQRIYGTAFFSPKELRVHLDLLEEAKKRDHRRLGRELDLFSLHEDIGGGLVVWHPKGALLRTILEGFERGEHLKRGYQVVMGPQILKAELWKKSGHLDYYRENMYFTEVDEQPYAIKPMNCLSHMFIYKSKIRSFRDLPLRFFELGTVQRQEKSGVLHGLTRVRQFTQDDAHIFCAPAQVPGEIQKVLELVRDMMAAFGFDYEMELSTRPEKSIGSDADWELATGALISALKTMDRPYELNEGDGAFYGPKIDIKLKDALGRRWQCATIQCDFTLPDRFDLSYTDSDNQRKRPVMLHRTVFGSLERFIGVLIEHFAGDFPVWLAPVQGIALTVTQRADEAAAAFQKRLIKLGYRVELDLRNEKLGFKIREAQLAKIPFILVFGDKEVAEGVASVRRRGQELGSMTLEALVDLLGPEAQIPNWD